MKGLFAFILRKFTSSARRRQARARSDSHYEIDGASHCFMSKLSMARMFYPAQGGAASVTRLLSKFRLIRETDNRWIATSASLVWEPLTRN